MTLENKLVITNHRTAKAEKKSVTLISPKAMFVLHRFNAENEIQQGDRLNLIGKDAYLDVMQPTLSAIARLKPRSSKHELD